MLNLRFGRKHGAKDDASVQLVLMLTFYFNLSRIETPGYGRFARVPGAKRAGKALAALADKSRIDLLSSRPSPLSQFPALVKRLARVGIVGIETMNCNSVNESEINTRLIRKVIRYPIEEAASRTVHPVSVFERIDRKSYQYKEFVGKHLRFSADPGDILSVHQAVKRGRANFFEIDAIWGLAHSFLSAEELLRIAAICKGSGITKVLAHPRFPIINAPDLIARYVARRMWNPDVLEMRPAKIEHHIKEVGEMDFYRFSTEETDSMNVFLRGFFWYWLFEKEIAPEYKFCDTIRSVRDGLKQRPISEQEDILQSMEQKYPQLSWLLRVVSKEGFDDKTQR